MLDVMRTQIKKADDHCGYSSKVNDCARAHDSPFSRTL